MISPTLSFFSVVWCVLLVSCDVTDPVTQSSLLSAGVNPLDRVGFSHVRSSETLETSDGAYRVGDYVEVNQPKTPLFAQYPRGGVKPLRYLNQGVVLNVLGLDGSYMHVQNENGDEGYVFTMTVVPQGLLIADLPNSDSDVAVIGE
jgi:hypothetical protein